MTTRLFLFAFLTGIVFCIANSCKKDDFLNENIDSGPKPYVYSSSDEMIQALDSVYGILRRGEEVERVEFYPTIASGDAMVGGEAGGNDQPAMQDMMKFQVTTNNHYIADYWTSMFEGVSLSNKFIQNATVSKDSSGIEESLRLRTIGEAYFLKALFYYKLTIMFCGFPQMHPGYSGTLPGLPMIDNVFDADSFAYERRSLDSTWYAITQYLLKASELLPERSEYSFDDIGRASKGAAKSLLAKIYVFTEQWTEGYQYARDVINSGEYYLEGDNEHPGPYTVTRLTKEGEVTVEMPAYKWIWQPEANNCGESVFDVRHYSDHTWYFIEGHMGNLIPNYYGIRNVWTYDIVGDLIPTAYYWGFILPTTYFVKTAYKDIGCEDMEGNILDPRFKITVISEGDSVPYYYENEFLRNTYPDSAMFNAWYNWPCTGNATWKYFTDSYYALQMTNFGDHPQNTKFLRFADVLLIGAEAALQVNQLADALTWVNKVRERARNSGTTGYPQDLAIVTPEDIWAERRVELAFEGHQFYDLVRTGRASQVLKEDAMEYDISMNPITSAIAPQQFGENYMEGTSEIMPIPQFAIDNSNGKLIQNPGY